MKLLTDWGFSWEGWKQGNRGEYWVLVQGLLLVAFVLLPVYRPVVMPEPPLLYGVWAIALVIELFGWVLLSKGFLDLGKSLTPLPYPREDGQLVRSGVYAIVRHPIYSGVILAALGWSIYCWSLSHAIGVLVFLVFFNGKASREENWLTEKYADYANYQQQVKKLIPWIF